MASSCPRDLYADVLTGGECLCASECCERCDIVGLNLLFDLGRIASYWSPAEDDYYGGWSLGLWGEYDSDGTWKDAPRHPRLRAKAIDPRRTLFGWGSIGKDPDFWKGRGRFVDLRTLAFALTDRGHTLESACAAFDVPYVKRDAELGKISPDLLAYAREDVAATAQLYFACLEELARHEGIGLEAHRLYSPATIGARYLDALGYQHPLEQFTNLDHDQLGWTNLPEGRRRERRARVTAAPNPDALTPELLGWAMSAFYGGRAEARIVRAPVTGGIGWADSAIFSAAGIPTVIFGPGGEGAHAAVEWVDLDQLDRCVGALECVIADFCG